MLLASSEAAAFPKSLWAPTFPKSLLAPGFPKSLLAPGFPKSLLALAFPKSLSAPGFPQSPFCSQFSQIPFCSWFSQIPLGSRFSQSPLAPVTSLAKQPRPRAKKPGPDPGFWLLPPATHGCPRRSSGSRSSRAALEPEMGNPELSKGEHHRPGPQRDIPVPSGGFPAPQARSLGHPEGV